MRAASRGWSSFHGIAKKSSYTVRIGRLHAAGLERILDLHLAPSKGSDIPVKVHRVIGAQLLQGSSEPALETYADRGELPFNGCLGELIGGDSKLRGSPLEVAKRLLIVEVECEGSLTHGPRLHLNGRLRRLADRPRAALRYLSGWPG